MPMSMPRYSCMESALTISPPSDRASRSDSPDFPAAVGPTTAITGCGMASVWQRRVCPCAARPLAVLRGSDHGVAFETPGGYDDNTTPDAGLYSVDLATWTTTCTARQSGGRRGEDDIEDDFDFGEDGHRLQ